MWRKKPAALRAERPIEFGLDSVGIPEQQIGPPLRAEAGHIHKCKTRPHRELDIAALRAIHFKGRLEHGGRIAFLDHMDEQPSPSPCRALPEVLLPVGIVESEGREQA